MSEHPKKTLQVVPQRQNRESHIDLGLIGHCIRHQIQERSQSRNESLDPIEETTTARDLSAQLGSSHPKEENASMWERYMPTDSLPPTARGQGFVRIKHDSPWKGYEQGYDLKLKSFVKVAVRKAPQHGKVAIRKFAGRVPLASSTCCEEYATSALCKSWRFSNLRRCITSFLSTSPSHSEKWWALRLFPVSDSWPPFWDKWVQKSRVLILLTGKSNTLQVDRLC